MLRGPQGLLETARRGGVRNPRGVLSRSDGSISRAAELHLSVHAQMPMPTKRERWSAPVLCTRANADCLVSRKLALQMLSSKRSSRSRAVPPTGQDGNNNEDAGSE